MARMNKAQKTERIQRAFELRKAGKTLRQIGEMLGYSHEMARKDIQGVITSLQQDSKDVAQELMILELARLDDMQFSVWPEARKGDRKSIETVLKIMERRAKILGLDIQRTVNVTLTKSELERMSDDDINELITQLTANTTTR
jgi:hypothetical protein